MRYLVLSDIHSNIEALEACIRRARRAGFDAVWCCGDIVGYGPNPTETIDAIRGLNPVLVRGNHDRAAAGMDDARDFNPYARSAILWTREALDETRRSYLAGLPVGPLAVDRDCELVHGAETHEDDYIFTEAEAGENLRLSGSRITFFGHTHFPMVFQRNGAGQVRLATAYDFDEFTSVRCDPPNRFLVNPGSVGQPRDGDARASFAIWDDDRQRLEFYRVDYDLQLTQRKMRTARLPDYLIERLAAGR